jgi:serine/threonine protein kinase
MTADELLAAATAMDLAAATDLDQAFHEAGGSAVDAAVFGQTLVRKEILTAYQLERLLAGAKSGFHYGKARLLYQVGAGSFSRVYRSIHRDTGEILAVKVLRRRHSGSPEKRAAFQREGEMGRLLHHPNIVSILDVGEEGGVSFITMEFVEGQTLRELARLRGRIEVSKAIDLMLNIVAGLEYAHRRGVAHRDLKASNVLVATAGVAKIVDFGLARVDASGDKVLGQSSQPRTIDYAALEKLCGVHDDDFRSDIYFLGTLAYLMFSGRPPLKETRDRNERADPRRFLQVEPLLRAVPDLPRDICDVVSRMMHLDTLERWQTIGEVRHALERLRSRHATSGNASPASPGVVTVSEPKVAGEPLAAARTSVMLVESALTDQESLRDFFQKLGCRVLLTSNPRRALGRFFSLPRPADCLILSSKSLGEAAVEAFNELSADSFLATVPALLLVEPRQSDIAERALQDERRKVVPLPLEAERILPALDAVIQAHRSVHR